MSVEFVVAESQSVLGVRFGLGELGTSWVPSSSGRGLDGGVGGFSSGLTQKCHHDYKYNTKQIKTKQSTKF